MARDADELETGVTSDTLSLPPHGAVSQDGRDQGERALGFALNRVTRKGKRRKVFLDEIEPGDPIGRDPNIQCGLFCSVEAEAMS